MTGAIDVPKTTRFSDVSSAAAQAANERLIELPVRLPALETSKRSKVHQRFLDTTAAGETDFKACTRAQPPSSIPPSEHAADLPLPPIKR